MGLEVMLGGRRTVPVVLFCNVEMRKLGEGLASVIINIGEYN